MAFKAILFDMIGTTVRENDPMFITNCFIRAFGEHNISVNASAIQKRRGQEKAAMITDILTELGFPQAMGPSILQQFRRNVEKGIDNFSPAEGARDIIAFMMSRGVKVGIGSGLPRDVFDHIMQHLQWNVIDFDYTGIAEETGRGRPHPDMIFDMLRKLNLDPKDLLKVGDTIADIQEGKNAGVKTAVILAGTQPEKTLRDENPDYIILQLSELRDIMKQPS